MREGARAPPKTRGRQAEGRRLPVRRRGPRLGPLRRRRVPGSALYDLKAWIVYGTQPHPGAAGAGRDDRRRSRTSTSSSRSTSCRPRSSATPTSCCPRRPTSSADDDVAAPAYKRAVPRAPPAGRPAAVRDEAGLVDRQGAAASARARRATSRGRTRASTWTRGSARAVTTSRGVSANGVVLGKPRSAVRGGGARARVRTAVEEDRALQRAAGDAGLRPAARSTPARGAAARARSGCSSAARRAHLRPHDEQPLPRRGLPRERGLGERRGGAVAAGLRPAARERRPRDARQPGRRAVAARCALKVTERIRPDCVFLVHGYGPRPRRGSRYAYGRGASRRALITRFKVDPIMGGTGMNVNFVQPRAAPGGARMSEALRHDRGHAPLRRLQRLRARLQGRERRARRAAAATGSSQEVRGEFPALHARSARERCNHCSDAPCVNACPTGASHVAEGGVVLVTHDKCTGCKACIAACPYDARYVHPDGLRRQVHVLPAPRRRRGSSPPASRPARPARSPSATSPIRTSAVAAAPRARAGTRCSSPSRATSPTSSSSPREPPWSGIRTSSGTRTSPAWRSASCCCDVPSS